MNKINKRILKSHFIKEVVGGILEADLIIEVGIITEEEENGEVVLEVEVDIKAEGFMEEVEKGKTVIKKENQEELERKEMENKE